MVWVKHNIVSPMLMGHLKNTFLKLFSIHEVQTCDLSLCQLCRMNIWLLQRYLKTKWVKTTHIQYDSPTRKLNFSSLQTPTTRYETTIRWMNQWHIPDKPRPRLSSVRFLGGGGYMRRICASFGTPIFARDTSPASSGPSRPSWKWTCGCLTKVLGHL